MTRGHCPSCGHVFEERESKRRSVPQHRRYFGIIKAAFLHWPAAHAFQPRDAEHLRKWLQVRAGRFAVRKTARIESADPAKVYALIKAFLDGAGSDLFLELHDNRIVELQAETICFDAMGPADFSRLKDEVCAVIETEIGISADQLLKETERAA